MGCSQYIYSNVSVVTKKMTTGSKEKDKVFVCMSERACVYACAWAKKCKLNCTSVRRSGLLPVL